MKYEEPIWLKDLKKQKKISRQNPYSIRVQAAGQVLAALYYNFEFIDVQIGNEILETERLTDKKPKELKGALLFTRKEEGHTEVMAGVKYSTQSDFVSPEYLFINFPHLVASSAGYAAEKVVFGIKRKMHHFDNAHIESVVLSLAQRNTHPDIVCPPFPLAIEVSDLLRQAAWKEAIILMECLEEEIVKIASSEKTKFNREDILEICGFTSHQNLWEKTNDYMDTLNSLINKSKASS
jgi:hypothetical protein